MTKKLISLLLALVLVFSMASLAVISASAALDSNGRYVPSEGITETSRYYFAMPKYWYSEYTDTAGIYWWDGSDACGAVDGSGGTTSWPGYKAQVSDVEDVYYVDCPSDVSTVIWNNFVNGGEDKEAPIYTIAAQGNNAPVEYYSDGDSDLYPTEFFEAMQESYDGDKAALGDFADNFFEDPEYGLSFTMDNMIFVIDPELTSENFEGKMTYVGDWNFYFGEGWYGTYPTKEASEAAGTLKNVNDQPTTLPSVPVTPGEPTATTVPAPSPDATSAVGSDSTPDTTPGQGGTDNGAIPTGDVSTALILFVLLAAASGAIVLTRKKFN